MIVITSLDENDTPLEPDRTVRHVCQENLGMINLYHNATIEACEQRYNDIYPLIRDFYHVIAALECKINSGKFKWPFKTGKEQKAKSKFWGV